MNSDTYDIMSAEDFLKSTAWVYKMEEFVFKILDTDKDGCVTREDYKRVLDHFQKQDADLELLDVHQTALERFNSEIFGELSDPLSRDNWLKKVAEVAAVDLKRMKQGEELIVMKTSETFFDLVDTNKDGFITLKEFKDGMVASGWDSESATQALKVASIGKDNPDKIERSEVMKHYQDFWYKTDYDDEHQHQ